MDLAAIARERKIKQNGDKRVFIGCMYHEPREINLPSIWLLMAQQYIRVIIAYLDKYRMGWNFQGVHIFVDVSNTRNLASVPSTYAYGVWNMALFKYLRQSQMSE